MKPGIDQTVDPNINTSVWELESSLSDDSNVIEDVSLLENFEPIGPPPHLLAAGKKKSVDTQ